MPLRTGLGPRNPNPSIWPSFSQSPPAPPFRYWRLRAADTTIMGFFDFVTAPTSYQNAQAIGSLGRREQVSLTSTVVNVLKKKLPPHSQHPNFGHLTLLVFEAVLEVVCVSLPGYLVARQGLFDAESQKFLANLNVTLFTPCLSKKHSLSFHFALANPTHSFHQACLPVNRREAYRASHHPIHLHRPNTHILPLRMGHIKRPWSQEEAKEFYHRYGRSSP